MDNFLSKCHRHGRESFEPEGKAGVVVNDVYKVDPVFYPTPLDVLSPDRPTETRAEVDLWTVYYLDCPGPTGDQGSRRYMWNTTSGDEGRVGHLDSLVFRLPRSIP